MSLVFGLSSAASSCRKSAMEDSSAMQANAQEFCLRWNNFHQSLVQALDGFKNDQEFVDVTLACEGQFLKAHKMLLSACSVFFRDLLKQPMRLTTFNFATANIDCMSGHDCAMSGSANAAQLVNDNFLLSAALVSQQVTCSFILHCLLLAAARAHNTTDKNNNISENNNNNILSSTSNSVSDDSQPSTTAQNANPCQHPIVILPPEVRFADLEKLLRFIYQGEVNVHQENLARFLKTAEMLKIRGLAEDSERQRVLRSSSPRPPEGGDSDSVSPKRPRLSIDVHQPNQEPQTPNDDSRLSGNDSDSEMIPVKQEMVELKDCSDSTFDGGDDAFIPEAYLREGGSASSSSQQTNQPAAPPPNAPPPPGPLLPSYVPPPQIKSQDGK
ncbi:hypothetical protein SK128_024521 [Halocaridina rubra]|uniref:BTB domain-containing protein n=1 Tax=Halocaridina rubra TaxID=373956 RepID=A0AAN9A2H4_HALRR